MSRLIHYCACGCEILAEMEACARCQNEGSLAAPTGSPWMRIVEMLTYALEKSECDGVMIEVRVHGADFDKENKEWGDMQQLDGCEFSTTCEHGDIQITPEELDELRDLISGNTDFSGGNPSAARTGSHSND